MSTHTVNTKRGVATVTLVLVAALVLASCATDDPNRRTKAGAGIGAIAGAVIGNQVGGKNKTSRVLGAAIGALAGGAVGRYQDNQQRDLEAALEEERRQKQIEVERLNDDVLRVSMSDEASFSINSAEIKPAFKGTLDKLAGQMSTYDKTVLHVVGYTDSTGSAEYNQALSRRRAEAVANYLRNDGVMRERLQTEGRGASEFRAPNDTKENRAKNRRVEVYINPIIEGSEDDALQRPTAS